jgi:hypothetical protein
MRAYTSIRNMVVLIFAVACFAAVYLEDNSYFIMKRPIFGDFQRRMTLLLKALLPQKAKHERGGKRCDV